MQQVQLHDSRTRRKRRLEPVVPGKVSMYVCGPTVYDRAHLGNARPVVVFDTLFRLLRHLYGAENVSYARNFTDVDDKINERARELAAEGDGRGLNEIIRSLTDRTIGWYHADMDALGARHPTFEPRATDWIGAMVAMIATLIGRGHAYAAEGHVLFDVRSFSDYGRLSGRSLDEMIAGARVEVAPFKRDPMDFVLWKPSAADEPGWPSPWGRGRPGWHIECSAMSEGLLGASFDIHGGGIDLMFPHHENEIAQSCCATPGAGFASIWMHNEMLLVEGRKMSKSLGNFFTVRDLLERGVPGEVIRFVLLSTHYRKPMDWTETRRQEAEATLRRWAALVHAGGAQGEGPGAGIDPAPGPTPGVLAALADDLNTPGAIAALHALYAAGDAAGLRASAALMGFDLEHMGVRPLGLSMRAEVGSVNVRTSDDDLARLESRLQEARAAARASGDFAPVDALKAALIAAGVEVRMTREGVTLVPGAGFDPAALAGIG